MAIVLARVARVPICCLVYPIRTYNPLTNNPPAEMVYLTTGKSSWPKAILTSLNCFFAISISACTDEFCVLNSCIMLVPLAYALLAVF